MLTIRPAIAEDVPGMAALRSQSRGTPEFWRERVSGYLGGERSPRFALEARAAFVAFEQHTLVGFVAGHLSARYSCDGELQWIDVDHEHRRRGIAGTLLRTMAKWFEGRRALRICVNVAPDNIPARALYSRFGASALGTNWMVWQDITDIARLADGTG